MQEKSIPECAAPFAAPGTLVCIRTRHPNPTTGHACLQHTCASQKIPVGPSPAHFLPAWRVTPGGAQHLPGPLLTYSLREPNLLTPKVPPRLLLMTLPALLGAI